MSFYDNVKEDSRPWRADHDTRAQALDTEELATAATNLAESVARSRQNGIVVAPAAATITVGSPTVALTATQISTPIGTVTWASSDPAKATVNASTGLVTRVANGTTTITATSLQPTGGKNAGIPTTGTAIITVTA